MTLRRSMMFFMATVLIVVSGLSEYNGKCLTGGKCLPCQPICNNDNSYNKQYYPFCERCHGDEDTNITPEGDTHKKHQNNGDSYSDIVCTEGEFKYKTFGTLKCVRKCPAGTYKTVDRTCVDSCIGQFPVEYKNTCYRQCPGDLYYDTYDCIKDCQDYYTIDKRCVSDCPKELPFLIENNNTCTDMCPNYTQVVAKTCKGPYTYFIMVPILVTIVVFLVIFFTRLTCYYMKTCPRKLKSEEDMIRHLLSANDEVIERDGRQNIVV